MILYKNPINPMGKAVDIIRYKHWLLLLGGIFLLCAGALLVPQWFSPAEPVAEIYQNGKLFKEIPLYCIENSVTIPIQNGEQENILLAENGTIRMLSANCPDKLCVHQGAIKNGASPIVCLPHRLVIQIKNRPASMDAISR